MNPLEVFQKEASEVAKDFDGLITALKETTGLDAKNKQLVCREIRAALSSTTAIYYHVPMAKKPGATREINDISLLTLSVVGLKSVASCLPVALEVYDKTV